MAEDKPKVTALVKPAAAVTITDGSKELQKTVNKFRIKDNFENYLWTVIGLDDCEWTKKALAILKEHGFEITCERNDIGTKIKIKIK
jgi:hypothetical protein